jgi:hypothetical protein
MSINYKKAPFPWAGGKSKAAPLVWELLGDPANYVEPFAGTMAVLLNRPHLPNRTYHSETVNDADGLLVNAWRAIQLDPDATAEAASWPVSEADLHARHTALIRWRTDHELEHLMGDPLWCDPVMAGWWLWGVCCWIGSEWCHGTNGPWWPDDNDRLTKRTNPDTPGVFRQRPALTNNGMGVNRPVLREPGAEFHDVTMPELRRWFSWLQARLRHVRIINGDWSRVTGTGAVQVLTVRRGSGHAGIFLDPPYSAAAGRAELYGHTEDFDVANDVRDWCVEWGGRPDYRIVLAGFEGEGHEELRDLGWTEHEWFAAGHLTGGYGQQKRGGTHQQHRERLWASPACVSPACVSDRQQELFG